MKHFDQFEFVANQTKEPFNQDLVKFNYWIMDYAEQLTGQKVKYIDFTFNLIIVTLKDNSILKFSENMLKNMFYI